MPFTGDFRVTYIYVTDFVSYNIIFTFITDNFDIFRYLYDYL